MKQLPPPRPEAFEDWKDWAAAVLIWLEDPAREPPVVTGSRGANVALTNLLKALATEGSVVDKTT